MLRCAEKMPVLGPGRLVLFELSTISLHTLYIVLSCTGLAFDLRI